MKNPLSQFTKKLIVSTGVMAVMAGARAQFAFPVYESFNYTNTANEQLGAAGDSATNWQSGNSVSGSSAFITTNAALYYPGLPADPNSPPNGLASKGTGKNRLATFTGQTNTIYASFLFNYLTNNGATADRIFFALSPNLTATGQPAANAGVWLTPAGSLKISKNSISAAATNLTAALVPSNTYLVVVRYLVTSGLDEVDLWLDPTSLGNNANIPTPTLSTTNNANPTRSFLSMAYESPSGALSNLFYMDEIRVGTNWAQVTPNSCSPGNTYAVGGGGTGCAGGSFPVTLSGSDSGVAYLLYTNGLYSGLSQNGTGSGLTFAAQSTTATYSILGSNTSSSCVGWMSGSATISVTTPPLITTQPSNAITVSGNEAVFTVSVSGLNLTYQWYKNGSALMDGGNISGSATPTLTISPATGADVATTTTGYSVRITDNCSYLAISTTNSLTLDSPANLYWIGGNGNSNWDLATTANFATTDGGTANTVFHSGDNVTFDDSTSTYVVNLTGSILSPSVLTENAGNTYVFTGSGSISGPGSLVMNGGGVLDILTANTYSGGTMINSGYILVSNANWQSLGTGPVTFNGGELVTEVNGSASVGLSNNIVVTANGGILAFNGTSSFGSVLFGSLTGSVGSTLTITTPQNPSSPSRIRVYNTNFTENGNINLNASSAPTFYFAPYNISGTQIYNGMISGNGSIITRGAGSFIFNGANTFTGNMQLSAGYSGIGIDSAGSPGSVTSGPFGIANLVLGTDGETATGNAAIFASGGAHTVGNNVIYTNLATDLFTLYIGGTNAVTLSGTIDLTDPNGGSGAVRLFNTTNTAPTTFAGNLIDNSLGSSQGNGIIVGGGGGGLLLNGANTYTGATIVTNNGLLGGSGSLASALIVQSNGTLAPGLQTTVRTLTVNNALTLQSNSITRVGVNSTGTHDLVTGLTSVTYAGTLNATNLSGTLSLGQTFQIFSAASHSGNFSAIAGTPGTGKAWSFNPATGVLSVVAGTLPPTNITYSVTATTLNLSWPSNYLGWTLEAQTNPLNVGLRTNWVRIAGSSNVTSTNFPLSTASGAVFFRLIYP